MCAVTTCALSGLGRFWWCSLSTSWLGSRLVSGTIPATPRAPPSPESQPSHVSDAACPQASLRVCGTCSSASVTTLPLLPPLRMATYNSGTSADLTGARGCSQPTMVLSSAVTGTPRTGMGMGGGHEGCRLKDTLGCGRVPRRGHRA